MDKKFGDTFKNLPLDPSQELPAFELQFMEGLRTRNKKIAPPKLEEHNDAETESDTESETSDVSHHDEKPTKSVMSDLSVTFIASILFLLFSNDIVEGGIKKLGIDGIKLLFVKVFLFAIFFFIIRYKFY
jgi:hypothetical protein